MNDSAAPLYDPAAPMDQSTARCQACRCLIEASDLFCGNCGLEVPVTLAVAERQLKWNHNVVAQSFDCHQCGASMTYDAAVGSLRCPYCGSTSVRAAAPTRRLVAERVVPSPIDRREVEDRLRRFLGSSFWHPGDLGRTSQLHDATLVYVPYWCFEAHVSTHYTADTTAKPSPGRGNWAPFYGHRTASYGGVLVAASEVLTPDETAAIEPFDLDLAVPVAGHDFGDSPMEVFRVNRKFAQPTGSRRIESLERSAAAGQVPGRHRNVQVNCLITAMSSYPVVLPVWVLAYRYRDQTYRVLVNGQSGQLSGRAPVSYWKIAMVGLGVGLVMLIVLMLTASR